MTTQGRLISIAAFWACFGVCAGVRAQPITEQPPTTSSSSPGTVPGSSTVPTTTASGGTTITGTGGTTSGATAASADGGGADATQLKGDLHGSKGDIFQQWANLMQPVLENRCGTAICFGGQGRQFALEPVLELPIGKAVRLPGAGGEVDLADRVVEGDAVNISVQAGVRFWLAYDAISIGLLFLNVSLKKDIPTPSKTFTSSALTTPAPGILVGLGGDLLQISAFRYVIRNDSNAYVTSSITYEPYQELSSGWMMMFSFAPFTALRNAGSAVKNLTSGDGSSKTTASR